MKSVKSKKSATVNVPTSAPVDPVPQAPETPMLDKDGKPLYGLLAQFARANRAELFTHAKSLKKFNDAVETAQAAFNGCKKFAGKVMAAMQVAYVSALNSRDITPDTKFEKYYEDNVGSAPNSRLQALGRVFNRLVEMGHITEAIYDAQSVDALETANAALSAIEKKYKGTGTDPKTTDEFKAVVNALHGLDAAGKPLIGTDTTKTLKALNKGLRGTSEKSDAKEGAEGESDVVRISQLTPEIALQLWDRIVAQGHAPACLVTLPDRVLTLDTEAQTSALAALDTAHMRTFELRKALLAGESVVKSAGGVVLMEAGQPAMQAAA